QVLCAVAPFNPALETLTGFCTFRSLSLELIIKMLQYAERLVWRGGKLTDFPQLHLTVSSRQIEAKDHTLDFAHDRLATIISDGKLHPRNRRVALEMPTHIVAEKLVCAVPESPLHQHYCALGAIFFQYDLIGFEVGRELFTVSVSEHQLAVAE